MCVFLCLIPPFGIFLFCVCWYCSCWASVLYHPACVGSYVFHVNVMAFNALSELHPGISLCHVRVYVSRLWHYRGGTDNGLIKHMDLIILNSQGNHICMNYEEIP